ncbi:MAG: SPOR domain-containing protein [Prevotella sp.]|nr:SPOR domain-containing protein [Prevotella sp.]
MKKYMVVCAVMGMALALASCGKSSESAYKKAYEKAKSQEAAQRVEENAQQQTTPTVAVTPVVTRPATQTTVVDNSDNVPVRQEKVTLINGTGLKAFSVVVGSFQLQANAEGLQQRLRDAGYSAQIVKNDANNMFRVVASTFDNKADATRSRDQFRAQEAYKDAWLLSFQ